MFLLLKPKIYYSRKIQDVISNKSPDSSIVHYTKQGHARINYIHFFAFKLSMNCSVIKKTYKKYYVALQIKKKLLYYYDNGLLI